MEHVMQNDPISKYEYIRNIVIAYIHAEQPSTYAIFNRKWNDELSKELRLPENYIDYFEFNLLQEIADKQEEYKLGWFQKHVFFKLCPPYFDKGWSEKGSVANMNPTPSGGDFDLSSILFLALVMGCE
jgi:hypothetical protein